MKALGAGFQMHVVKPVEPAELVTVCRQPCGTRACLNPLPDVDFRILCRLLHQIESGFDYPFSAAEHLAGVPSPSLAMACPVTCRPTLHVDGLT